MSPFPLKIGINILCRHADGICSVFIMQLNNLHSIVITNLPIYFHAYFVCSYCLPTFHTIECGLCFFLTEVPCHCLVRNSFSVSSLWFFVFISMLKYWHHQQRHRHRHRQRYPVGPVSPPWRVPFATTTTTTTTTATSTEDADVGRRTHTRRLSSSPLQRTHSRTRRRSVGSKSAPCTRLRSTNGIRKHRPVHARRRHRHDTALPTTTHHTLPGRTIRQQYNRRRIRSNRSIGRQLTRRDLCAVCRASICEAQPDFNHIDDERRDDIPTTTPAMLRPVLDR